MRFVILLLLLPFYCSAQVIFSGKVVEESTGNCIPYATIGLVKQNIGTNADEKGKFTIRCLQPNFDTLIVSCIGYSTIHIPITDLTTNSTISLRVSEKRLKPVFIKNSWSYNEVGTYKSYQDYCLTSNGYQSQVAKKLSAPSANAYLQAVHVGTSKHQGQGLFRIHVYACDSLTRGPGQELTDTIIQAKSKNGINTIDMSPYQILLPDKDFFVSIEWLNIPSNEYHFSAKYEGQDTAFLHYNPCICFTKESLSDPEEIWNLSYSGNWYPRRTEGQTYDLAIAATVKY